MTTTITETSNQVVAKLSGELDTAAAPVAEHSLQSLADKGKDIVIDCSELEYISSSGLRIFLSILKQAQPFGKQVVLKNVNDVIRDVLEISGFISLFVIE